VVQACQGLDYAHRQGVVHRDVKPGNLLRSPDGTVKLADFGIAKAAEQSSITQVGSVLGTAAYLAPEQAQGEQATPQSDLYSLGVVTYQLLAGRLPYEAASLSELVLRQQQGPPPSLHELQPEVPPSLATAVMVALSINPHDRYPSAQAMAVALEDAARGITPETTAHGWGDTEATSVVSRTDATRAVQRTPAPVVAREPVPARRQRPAEPVPAPAARAPRRRGRRWGRALTLLLIVLLVGAGVGIAVVSSMDNEQQVQLRDTVRDNVNDSVEAMKQLIEDNTR
jgi:serine/threonine-protein kinase